MKEDVCIISFETNEEQIYDMEEADIFYPMKIGSDGEDDFKE
jgi:hypothetical protein